MNDFFSRDRLNILTGLTVYSQLDSGGTVNLTTGTFVDLLSVANTDDHTIISAYQVTIDVDGGDLTLPVFRLLAAPTGVTLDSSTKIFPFGDEVAIGSGVTAFLQTPLQIPEHHDYKLQVSCTFTTQTPTAELDFLSIISINQFNHE